ncbi:unnamed protein product [Schistosoma margrebowiei]|uniref:Uncharacterized protein n=1 Tax=Schistosoma margrebowiei TaxID=48269 RepID=A0A183MH38_9TREM|nr:unnamed protein product [Schistosoma margrebowiei]
MDSRKLIPPGSEYDEERKQIRSRLTKSLRNDREQWWATEAKEMEKAATIGNTKQGLLLALSNNARMFGMRFSPSKCKLLLQDWPMSTPELRLGSEVVERVDNFTYLGSLISPNGLVSDEISARIRKARLVFANLRHLWGR